MSQFADLSDGEDYSSDEQLDESIETGFISYQQQEYFSDDNFSEEELKPTTIKSNQNLKNTKFHSQLNNDRVSFAGGSNVEKASLQPQEKALSMKFESKINLDGFDKKIYVKDKADRATVENVLDPRTRNILFKLLRANTISSVNGCISTGKEANVYHCSTPEDEKNLALKVYKTSILVFKDRSSYTHGEFRFRQGYKGKNPRKMVAAWAEKEVRNLNRLEQAGIPAPKPVFQRQNVLLMDFLGQGNNAAPRLKDLENVPVSKWSDMYVQVLKAVRKIFQTCRLVHADLSEYNMLFHDGIVYIIDVSQSVEHDHPNALTFLRKDCYNVNQFFARQKVRVCTCREFTDFVLNFNLKTDEEEQKYLDELFQKILERGDLSEKELLDDQVFKESYISNRLDQIKLKDVERDLLLTKMGETSEILYATANGLDKNLKPVESDTDSENSEKSQKSEDEERIPAKHREKDEVDKKAHKKAVKEANKERRKSKTPKHVKKRKEKVAKTKK